MAINIICSLNVRNKSSIVRQIGTGILGPKQAGLFHFRSLSQVKHVIDLEKKNQVSVESPIPTFISVQLNGGELPEETPVAPVADPVVDQNVVKPDYYLNWDEVESKSKPELQEWFEQHPAEGLSLAKNKNATATKEIVHAFLAGQFEDHVAPESDEKKEEGPADDEGGETGSEE